MSFSEYNTRNLAPFLAITCQITEYSENDPSQASSLSLKAASSVSTPPSPKKNPRKRTVTVSEIIYTPQLQHTRKVRFSRVVEKIEPKQEEKKIALCATKTLLKPTTLKCYADELPSWWTYDEFPSLATTSDAKLGFDAKFDRQLVYEYVRHIRISKAPYQDNLETFLPINLKHLLSIITDASFVREIKQVNSMITDEDISKVRTSFQQAKATINRKLFD